MIIREKSERSARFPASAPGAGGAQAAVVGRPAGGRRPRARSRRLPGPGRSRPAAARRRRSSATAARSRSMSACEVDRPALARTAPGISRRSPREHGVPVGGDLGRRRGRAAAAGRGGRRSSRGAPRCRTRRSAGPPPGRGARPSTMNVASGRVGVGRGSGPSSRTPSMAASPDAQPARPAASWAAMAVQPMRPNSSMAASQGDGADDVGRAGLLPLGRIGPDHLVQIDQVDRAAAGQERVALGEGGPGPDQHAGAERGVHLVPAPGHVVGRGGQRPVGRPAGRRRPAPGRPARGRRR